MARKKVDFEQRLEALEALVEQMEAGDLTLEESLQAFEQGIRLTRECQSELTAAEQKVQILIEEQGQLQVHPFETDEE